MVLSNLSKRLLILLSSTPQHLRSQTTFKQLNPLLLLGGLVGWVGGWVGGWLGGWLFVACCLLPVVAATMHMIRTQGLSKAPH